MGIAWNNGYSADVEIFLYVGAQKLAVAQVGGYSLIMRDSCSIAPGAAAQLVTSIDGRANVRDILLHEGISPDCRKVEFSPNDNNRDDASDHPIDS